MRRPRTCEASTGARSWLLHPTTGRIAAARDPQSLFRKALQDLDTRLLRGEPFSGHERKCVFLNTGAERWATVSHISGFDFEDDTRALGATDWDGDGDVDVWLTNRNAPMVRYLRNDTPRSGDFLVLKLRQDTGNRDAIGAKVEVRLKSKNSRPLLREVRAGDSYLSQSSLRLHFGLGPKAEIAEVLVRWPGGPVESFSGAKPNAAWLIRKGAGRAEPLANPHKSSMELKAGPVLLPPGDLPVAVPLAHTLPVPRIDYTSLSGAAHQLAELKGSPVFVTLVSGGFEACAAQFNAWQPRMEDLKESGLRLFAAGVDETEETSALLASLPEHIERGVLTPHAKERLETLYNTPFEIELRLNAPSGFTFDAGLRLLTVYRGPADADQLLADVRRARFSPQDLFVSSQPFSGTWFRPPTPWAPLEFVTLLLRERDWDAAGDFMTTNREEFRRSRRYSGAAKVMADAMTSQNRAAQAIPYYRECLKDSPGDPAVMNNLAHNLIHQTGAGAAAAGEAVSLAAKAVEITGGKDAAMLDTLARAFLAAGNKEQALTTARRALTLAKDKGQTDLQTALDEFLKSMSKDG